MTTAQAFIARTAKEHEESTRETLCIELAKLRWRQERTKEALQAFRRRLIASKLLLHLWTNTSRRKNWDGAGYVRGKTEGFFQEGER